MSISRFKVEATLDSAGGKKKGTVIIDRETGVVSVRPHLSRVTYQSNLADVANRIVKEALLAGHIERFDPKKAARRKR